MRAVITGGVGSLGRALIDVLYEYDIVLVDKKEEKGDLKADLIKADLTSEEETKAVFEKIGSVDLLVLCAGTMERGDLFEASGSFDEVFDVNVKSSWLPVKYANLNDNGSIVFISSRHALSPRRNPGLYSLTKKSQAFLGEVLRETVVQSVKIAYLGPFESPISLKSVSEEELEEKKAYMRSPREIAKLLKQLIESNKYDLVFNEESKEYFFR